MKIINALSLLFFFGVFAQLNSQSFGILPVRFDFKIVQSSQASGLSALGGKQPFASNSVISGDCVYDEIYADWFVEELQLQFKDYEYLSTAPQLDESDLSEEEQEAEVVAFNSTLGNSMYYDPKQKAREERGRTNRRSEMAQGFIQLRPDLINPLADKLDRDVLIYFGGYGIHWLRRNQDPETVQYPDLAKGEFSLTAWVVDGISGEVLVVSSVSTARRSAAEKRSVPMGFLMPQMIPMPGNRPALSERTVRNKVGELLSHLHKELEKAELLR